MRDARKHPSPILAPFLAMITTLGLIGLPMGASPIQTTAPQQNPPQQTPAPQPDPSQQPPAQQTPAQQPPAAQPDDSTADQPSTPPGVKNSKDDVNKIGERGVGKGVNFYSLEREIALGKQLAQEVERSAKFVDDPIVVDYVNRVGQNLVRNSDARVPFTIKVIDADQINAFALPGGFFYVFSGLILHADEESELAGVMAHEIAHVAARHGTRGQTKGELAQLAMIPAMIFIPYSWAGWGMYEALQFAIPLTFLKFSRDYEREADFLGLQYMYKAGYDPNSYVTFFEKIQAEERRRPGSIPKAFSTHPPTAERIRNIQEEIARILPVRGEYIVTTSEFDVVKARLKMIQNRSKLKNSDPSKPSLRKRTDQDQTKTGQDGQSDDDRPTLKRRPDSP
ncbi:MAG TPA: M48 family metallopeptidase [Candidatus Acidoferrales bacterium]|nr:M48 family metallopeptidase [Candidatus Acidoferrales bacterium]